MTRSPDDHLADILDAIERIRVYTRDGKEAFKVNSMIRDAVAACLMQIGQCVKDAQADDARLPQRAPAVPWREIAGMRDRLAHKYWQVDQDIVWNVIESQLEILKKTIDSLLKEKRATRRSVNKSLKKGAASE